jgi:hypothetical protein
VDNPNSCNLLTMPISVLTRYGSTPNPKLGLGNRLRSGPLTIFGLVDRLHAHSRLTRLDRL